jgi:hypothetical protein
VRAALTDEDEIAHGEAFYDGGLGVCAYCRNEWPCRTQQGINRLLARLAGEDSDSRAVADAGEGSEKPARRVELRAGLT